MPVPYQYTALGQFDNDPDDESVDPEHCLNMMAEDTSSDEEIEATDTNGKTIGAIDLNEPPNANEVFTRIQVVNTVTLNDCFRSLLVILLTNS